MGENVRENEDELRLCLVRVLTNAAPSGLLALNHREFVSRAEHRVRSSQVAFSAPDAVEPAPDMESSTQLLWDLLPTGITLAIAVAILITAHFFLERRRSQDLNNAFNAQLIMLGLTAFALMALILALPISDALRGQVLSLVGVVLSAIFALSSTTFVGNAMAGVLLKVLKNFRVGDFVRIADHFGRVSERGLFHTEIQTPESDLTTLPNLFLVTNPLTVIRSTGTFVHAEVSLGYDIPRTKIEKLLLAAAEAVPLKDPFVHVRQLGDFSVSYRVSGLLEDVKQLITTQSQFKGQVLDHLHEGGVEIVSPTFMNTRPLTADQVFIPRKEQTAGDEGAPQPAAEQVVFEKAELAESLQNRSEELTQQIEDLKKKLETADSSAKEGIQKDVDSLEKERSQVQEEMKKNEG